MPPEMMDPATAPAEGVPAADLPTEQHQDQPQPSLRDRLEDAFDQIEDRERREEAQARRVRDERGRFAGPKQATPETEQRQQGRPAAEQAPQRGPNDPIPAPEGWGDKAKVDWNRLPRSVQEEITARLAAAQQPAEPQPDPYREAIAPYEQEFRRRGVDPAASLRTLLDTWYALEANPRDTLAWLASRYGLALADDQGGQYPPQHTDPNGQVPQGAEGGQPAGQPPTDIQHHPFVRRLLSEIAELREAVGHTQQMTLAQQREQLAQRVAEAAMQVDRFAKETDADGNPLRPHFDKVREKMATLIRMGQARDLADAYEQAVWADPEIRKALIEEERKREAKRAAEEATRRAAEARRAAMVNVRSSPGASPAPPRSLRQTLEEAYDQIAGSA